MSPLFRRFGFRLALILVLVHPGCSDQKSVEKETTPSTTSPGQEAVPLPEPTETGFAVPGSGVEPPAYDETMGGWDTERIAEEGKSLLKKALTSALETSESPSPPKFLSPDFSAYLVDPEQLKTVYSKGSLTLVESKDASPTAADWPPFAMLLADQWVPDSAHLALKVVGVAQPEPASARLDLRLQVDGELPEEAGREQRNAVLESRWSVDGADLKLTSLTMNGWTIARAQRGTEGERLFTDRATAVLGGNASYHKQMIPGLDHWLATFDNKIGMLVGGWTGLAIGDANGDGLDDLYVCQSAGLPNRLYIQQPDGTAVDVSSASGIDWIETTRSALFADFDNDGDQDLVLGLARGLVFQANDGRGNFKTAFTQTLPAAVPYSLAAGDYDQDGRLDLFVCCYNQRGLINRNEVLARPIPYHDANSGGRNVLLRNEGKFRFTHVTRALGLDEQSRRYSYAAAWEDFDNDGDLDLYV
ncbi:MAG: VCBS repeat-containing protein, partial [Verrucomicrobiota bacterium]